MRQDKIEVYVHLIWTTWERTHWITPELERLMFPVLCEIANRHNALVLGVNGTGDHVHLLVKFSSTTRLCDLVKDAKGASSRLANDHLGDFTFKWRPTYAAFSVSRWNVRALCAYITRQKEHHAANTTNPHLESDE